MGCNTFYTGIAVPLDFLRTWKKDERDETTAQRLALHCHAKV